MKTSNVYLLSRGIEQEKKKGENSDDILTFRPAYSVLKSCKFKIGGGIRKMGVRVRPCADSNTLPYVGGCAAPADFISTASAENRHQSVVRVTRDCWSRPIKKHRSESLTSFRCRMSSGNENQPQEAASPSPCNGQEDKQTVADGHCSPAQDLTPCPAVPKGFHCASSQKKIYTEMLGLRPSNFSILGENKFPGGISAPPALYCQLLATYLERNVDFTFVLSIQSSLMV
ncbi:hypothetical protein GWI33_001411 [Rhynchophorus ferrugineus]|uniref:Uncharacterized protein n=1 Tax=Rhynchophorus ferrugineus TaxID=354439 RepID=A0A834IUH9_RHYFE|nr:hypothetical protein GWI33_001411 [Rhynchophorus ferrugineus]